MREFFSRFWAILKNVLIILLALLIVFGPVAALVTVASIWWPVWTYYIVIPVCLVWIVCSIYAAAIPMIKSLFHFDEDDYDDPYGI